MKRWFWTRLLSVAALTVVALALFVSVQRTMAQQSGAASGNAAVLKEDEPLLLNALYPKGKDRSFTEAAGAFRVNSRRMIDKKWNDDFLGPYNYTLNWYKPVIDGDKAGLHLATHSAFAESPNRILVAHSGEDPFPKNRTPAGGPRTKVPPAPTRAPIRSGVIAVNRNGEMIEDWAPLHPDTFVFPHAITECPFDPEKSVWVTDREGQQILKFSNDGKKLLMRIGEKGKAGYDNTHFNMPSDVTCLPDGSIFVADGYVNSRVVKFDKNGKFIAQIGAKDSGDQPGQFNLIHTVAVDKQGRLYVGDRGNHRIQIFDPNLKYITELGIHTPCNIQITQDGFLWVSSCSASRIMKFDLNGKLLYHFGQPSTVGEGGWGNTHNHTIDSDGNVYIVDEGLHALLKLTPRTDADKSHLVSQPYTH